MTNPESLRGLPMRELLRRHNIRCHRVPFLIREFLAEQSRTIAEARLHEGVPETLAALSKARVRHGIVSSNSEANIRACLEQNAVDEYFEFVVGMGRLFGKKKALKQALRLARLRADEVLYVGDETRDVRAAHQVRMPIACVTWGVNSEALLREFAPEHIIADPQDLLGILRIPSPAPPSV